MKQLAVAAQTASPPDADLGLGAELTGWQLYNRREHIGFRIRIYAAPWRLAAQVGRGEVSAALGIEQILDSAKVEKESVAATAGEERVGAGLDDVGVGAEGDLGVGDDLCPDRFHRAGLRAFCDKNVYGLLTVLRRWEHIAERNVVQIIAIIVDGEPVDGVGMERVGSRICIEDEHGPCRVRGRLECIEVA